MHVHIYVHAFILHLNIHACIFIIFVVIRVELVFQTYKHNF